MYASEGGSNDRTDVGGAFMPMTRLLSKAAAAFLAATTAMGLALSAGNLSARADDWAGPLPQPKPAFAASAVIADMPAPLPNPFRDALDLAVALTGSFVLPKPAPRKADDTPAQVGLDQAVAAIPIPPAAIRPAQNDDEPVAVLHPDSEDAAPSGTRQVKLTVRRGDTLMSMLTGRAGLDSTEAHAAVDALRGVFDPRKLSINQEITLYFKPGSKGESLKLMAVESDIQRVAYVSRDKKSEGFSAETVDKPLRDTAQARTGVIESSLFAAAAKAGVPDTIMSQMIRQLSYTVDFQRDLQAGDRFEVMYETKTTEDGKLVRTGDMLLARMILSGVEQTLYRYEMEDGGVDYFNSKGESLRKGLLRTPIDGARLTSRFGMRTHPMMGFTKMHRGVDFGAPIGTPVFAAGSGTVEQIGRWGAYGNYIRVRHNGEIATAYAHLSRFANGLRQGARIRQGDIIGYVGMTGRSTGPHLHYEIIKGKTQVNPLSVDLPVANVLSGKDLRRFQTARAELERRFARLPTQDTLVAQGRSR